jgi:hypothetical protein
MSEDVPEYKARGELKFVRLKNAYDDLVGYVTYGTDYLTIEMPLRVEIETIFEEGRQILSLQEYLPQSLVEIKTVDIPMEEVMFSTPLKKEFYEQYEYCRDFFYENETKSLKTKQQKVSDIAETAGKMEKVVSILEAMQAKKDKPVH